MRGTPSRRGAVPLITMNSIPKKLIVPALVVFAFLLLCVRPAAAVTPATNTQTFSISGVGSFASFDSAYAWKCSHTGWSQPSVNYPKCWSGDLVTGWGVDYRDTITIVGAVTCPINSTKTDSYRGICSCNSGFVESSDQTSCVSPLTPHEQSAQDAKNAALAAGFSAAAAQAAQDAVLAHSASPAADWPYIGSTAARNSDYATGRGLNAATAAAVAAEAANLFASNTTNGFDAMQRASLADIIVGGSVDRHLARQAVGQSPSTAQLVAGIAAGVLTTAAVGMAVAGAAPVSIAIAASAALHTGILAVVDTGASAQQQQAAVSAGARAIQSGATPLQVTLAPQVVAAAVPAAASESQITAASLAAVSAFMTAPESSWSAPAVGMPNNTASVAASVASNSIAAGASTDAAAAAAAAAVQTIVSGGTVAAASTASQAASNYVAGGGSLAGAAVIGQQVGSQADGATEGTLKGVLGQLSALTGFGQGVAVDDGVVPGADRVNVAKNSFDASILGMQDAAILADEADEQSLLGAFIFDPQYVACQPFTKQILGRTATIDLCSHAAMLRELIGWLFALLGAYTIYQTIFRARA